MNELKDLLDNVLGKSLNLIGSINDLPQLLLVEALELTPEPTLEPILEPTLEQIQLEQILEHLQLGKCVEMSDV